MSEQDWQPCGFVYTQAVSVPREKKKKKKLSMRLISGLDDQNF